MSFYVYVYSDPRNDVPFYVGKGKGERSKRHLSSSHSKRLTDKIAQLTRLGLAPKIEILNCESEQSAFLLERQLIILYGRRDRKTGTLMNQTEGGEGASGRRLSLEARQRISESKKGKPCSDAHRAAMSAARKAIMTPEFRAAIGERSRNPSPETRAKIGAASRGRKHSDELKAHFSKLFSGRVISAEQREKLSKATAAWHARRKAQETT